MVFLLGLWLDPCLEVETGECCMRHCHGMTWGSHYFARLINAFWPVVEVFVRWLFCMFVRHALLGFAHKCFAKFSCSSRSEATSRTPNNITSDDTKLNLFGNARCMPNSDINQPHCSRLGNSKTALWSDIVPYLLDFAIMFEISASKVIESDFSKSCIALASRA